MVGFAIALPHPTFIACRLVYNDERVGTRKSDFFLKSDFLSWLKIDSVEIPFFPKIEFLDLVN